MVTQNDLFQSLKPNLNDQMFGPDVHTFLLYSKAHIHIFKTSPVVKNSLQQYHLTAGCKGPAQRHIV